jgi:hypothetical protein
MPDCTHLIVGDYNTAKYRHVAKERPDVKAMATGWVEAVRNLWVQDTEIDFSAVEREWQLRTFETGGGDPTPDGTEPQRRKLICCMTGFEDSDSRQQIIDSIESHGGIYTGDLTKRLVTHLIVYKPEGRKYQAAKSWGIQTVAAEWVHDSIERGLILDEKLYDPILAKEERGVGAWNKQRAQRVSSLGKRLRENNAVQDEGKRKLRKTASMKLNSQRDNLWGDILGKAQASEPLLTAVSKPEPTNPATLPITQPTQPSGGAKSLDTQGSKLSSFGVPDDSAVFASCCFYVHGFSAQKTEILVNTAASLGGLICHSLDEVVSTSGAQLSHRFLIVPQTSAPDTHPRLPNNVHIITEYYIERCLHKKYFFDPSQHVIGRPFPLFPIPGFEDLSICTAGFTGVDLNQVDKSIRQLGGKYEERFTANISLLVCSSLSVVRKQKLELAVAWKVPVVNADWLWECISAGFKAPIKRFLFPELKQNLDSPKSTGQGKEKGKEKDTERGKQGKPSPKEAIDKDLLPRPATKPKPRRDLDESAFATAKEQKEPRPTSTQYRKVHPATEHDSNITTTTHFETAATHLFSTSDVNISFGNKSLSSGAPLSEASSNSLNKSPPSPQKQHTQRPRKPMSRITSEVADSEATDGDVGHPSEMEDDEENNPHEEPNQGGEGPAAAQQRVEAEKATNERLAISKDLATSLFELGATATTAVTTTTTTAIAAPIPETSSDDARPKRRKREILGRAISNVSAASASSISTSTETNHHHHHHHHDTTGGKKADAAPVASTQLEYEDPEAKRYKEELMTKMLGGKVKKGVPPQEKLTLAGMGGYDVPQWGGGYVGGGGGGGYVAAGRETRATRRR